ncbi:MAG: amino acid ABC transporter substrate-binding protein, partial [Desulfobacteraceae bacterium]|nr:amino acid ABC transporter substrate-binding protein [Desulfobacteraceae bacterium]
FPFKTLQDLADHTTFLVGNVRGCYLGEAFENLSKNPAFAKRIQEVPKDIQNIRKAVAGRIDGFFAEPNYVVYTTRQMGWGNKFEIHPMPVISSPVHLMLSKKTISPELKNKINQGIEKIKADGRHRAIIESYLK